MTPDLRMLIGVMGVLCIITVLWTFNPVIALTVLGLVLILTAVLMEPKQQ